MRLITLLPILLVLCASTSNARFVQIWSYDDLVRKSDVVLIVSVSEVSKRTGTQKQFHDQSIDSVLTKFQIQTVLTGEYDSSSLDLHHLDYPENVNVIINGWGFKWFDKEDDTFLVFLKKMDSGVLSPVTGHEDLGMSFVEIRPDMSTVMKSMEWKTLTPNHH